MRTLLPRKSQTKLSLDAAPPSFHSLGTQVWPELSKKRVVYSYLLDRDFPDSSVGKESTCNAGDASLIPGSGRSTGEEIGYPLQYSWASFVAQLVKNPPAMWETWVRFLGWEDPLENE